MNYQTFVNDLFTVSARYACARAARSDVSGGVIASWLNRLAAEAKEVTL